MLSVIFSFYGVPALIYKHTLLIFIPGSQNVLKRHEDIPFIFQNSWGVEKKSKKWKYGFWTNSRRKKKSKKERTHIHTWLKIFPHPRKRFSENSSREIAVHRYRRRTTSRQFLHPVKKVRWNGKNQTLRERKKNFSSTTTKWIAPKINSSNRGKQL